MTDKIYQISEIKDIVSPIAKEYGLRAVYIFGSYARREATERSDIDFYIPSLPPKMGIKYFGMYEDIKEAVDKNIDIVTDNTQFIYEIERNCFFSNVNKDKVEIYG